MQGQKTYISVILPLKLDWEASYFVPEEMGEIKVGDRVRVIFANKKYLGVVSETNVTPNVDNSRVMSVLKIERGLRAIKEEEITLWKKIAEYYLCNIGEVYKTAYPSEKISREESHLAAIQKVENSRRKIQEQIENKIARLEERLAKKTATYENAKAGTKGRAKAQEDIAKIKGEIDAARTALTACSNDGTANHGTTNYRTTSHNTSIFDAGSHDAVSQPNLDLSSSQKSAYKQIKEAFNASKPVLLHGVTGSGKTEIYIKLAKETLQEGRNVLYLVPEIALSRQLEDRLQEHFSNTLMTYHSGKSSALKRDIAEKIASTSEQEPYVVLGTRSALFLPHHNLGLIIVDEEHDNSYKQDSPAPYYNGRDTALMLSVIQSNCNIILGSATPSLEERYNCQTGRHILVELNERYHGSEDSEIEIIDTRAERRKNGMRGNFSRKLIDQIEQTLKRGEQVMILRSRRSWAPVLQCENCGAMPKCPHCNVSLSLHKSERGEFTACHHCGYRSAYKGTCSKCGSSLKTLGAGTQRIEEEAKALFPDAVIARLDSDISQNKTKENQIIKDFSAGRIQILIGTQILTKGFDFGNLTLVSVIAADTLLGMQDFRADEKAMQLLEQFRGRCGRREKKGKLIIQTLQPEHPVYQNIANNSSFTFSSSLLCERKDFGFPPYSRIIEISVKDTFEDRAERMSTRLAGAITGKLATDVGNTVVGPYQPAISKVANNHIRIIRICLRKDRYLQIHKKSLTELVRVFEKENRYMGHISVNVDPS